jgi:hypothetical protein
MKINGRGLTRFSINRFTENGSPSESEKIVPVHGVEMTNVL